MGVIRHGNPGEWAKVNGTVLSLWPLYLCFTALGALGASIAFGRYPLAFAAAFAVMVVALSVLWRKGVRRVESYFKGARGEERVAAVIEALPGAWSVFHDFEAGGYHVDHVLVGAAGVFSIETKNWSGRVTVDHDEVFLDGRLPDRSPLAQTQKEADAVAEALRTAGWKGEVKAVLCLASDTFTDDLKTVGRVTVLNASRLAAWALEQPSVLAANEQTRLTQLMETHT